VIRTEEEHLAHYGILRRSGRYPWGSGASESTRNRSFLDIIDMHRKDGMSESEIAKYHGITTTQLRASVSEASAQQRQEKILTAQRLKEKGWSNVEIGRRMNLNESSVRNLLAPGAKDKADALQTTANMLKSHVDEKKYIDVSVGVEHQVGVTRTRLDTAIAVLREKGYELHIIKDLQLGTGKYTTSKILATPGTKLQEVQRNRKDIKQITDHSVDHGRNYISTQPPISIRSRRIAINYAEDGGAKADGVIYVRPGVKDLSIGSSRYAQVRIAVDGTHYLKGMAVYKDDLPAGVDLVFNTNKSDTGRKKDAMQVMENDPDNPFGAIIRQVHGPDGKVSSAMNIVGSPTKLGSGEEGSWDTWSRNLPSQMLSKQNPALAKQQLNLTYERRLREYNEISSLTNPTVRKDLLLKFADQTDSAAVHLQAASLPRQATKVLLPVPSMKDNEIYAPSMRDGELVAVVRFPHGGTFEIPQLTVNNRNREARRMLGSSAKDAVGVNHKVAHHLSGADFDGDTVLIIPNNKRLVKSTPALEGLKDFDPQVYKLPKDSPIPRITSARKQQEMGKVSNLITDMTIHGASTDELARALRHSMVVIDSEKHGLDFVQSAKDNGILSLKEKYQEGTRGGAKTLISRARAPVFINERQPRSAARGGPIDPVTGRKVFEETGRMVPVRKVVTDPSTGKKVRVETGRIEPKKIRSRRLAETEDAFTLSSGTQMETIYAEHSNRLKGLANTARKQALPLKGTPYSSSAKKVYANEVASLNAKLNIAEKNAPYERQAQRLANASVSQKRQANPHMEPEDIKKVRQQALNEARIRTGAHKTKIIITQPEWNAIQAGALSIGKLERVLNNSDINTVKALALPKHTPKMTSAKITRAKSMLASGYTQAEVADALGIGLTTLKVGLNE
jgi:DNA-binding CsgD family transcriptional regulator